MHGPFYPTLLSTARVSHELTDSPPENIVIGVFSLLHRHIHNDIRQSILFLFRPVAYKTQRD